MAFKSVQEAFSKVEDINSDIRYFLSNYGYYGEDVPYDREDLEEAFLFNQLGFIAEKLEEAHNRMKYLSKPVTEQGFIQHNELKRYELPSGYYFTSGSSCEILHTDSDGQQYWTFTSIEHNGEDYYATSLGGNVNIDGKMVRVRR